MAPLPIKFQELVQLGNLGVDTQSIGFNSCVSLLALPSCAHDLLVFPSQFETSLHRKVSFADPNAPRSQTLESDSYVCIREKKSEAAQPEVVIVELKNDNNVTRRPIKADSAIMHWKKQIIALKAQSRTLQIFDLEQKKKLKSCTMSEDVQYWKWISESTLGLITTNSVYHWDVYDAGQDAPVKVFERNANLNVSANH